MQQLLLSAVAPRPIAFASTISAAGEINLSPYSFFNAFSANPPILIFSPARRVRDNTTKHTLENVLEVPECVINIMNYGMVEQASLASTEYPRGTNEFVKAGFTEAPSEVVKPPRVAESPVAFECKVNEVIHLGTEGGAGNLVICEVLLVHLHDNYATKEGKLDQHQLDLVARLGGNYYARASGDALFEIPKPLTTLGVGVDALPKEVRVSNFLTGNQLGRLGNTEQLPTAEGIKETALNPAVSAILNQTEPGSPARTERLHKLAAAHLKAGENNLALHILFQPH